MSPPKTALVTGCSAGGIGAALALALSKRGLHVFATARNPAKIPAELSRLANNVTVLPLSLDVTSAASVAAAVAAVEESGAGGLDMLVNNAGAGYAMPLLDVDIAAAQELYETNLWGVLRMVQGFAGLLIARRGHVVNISSVGSLLNTPWIGTYASSKAALNILSETLRLELAPYGVSVTTVMAGTVETQFHANDTAVQDFHLPAGSRYASIQHIIATWANGSSVPKGCPVEEFAEALADKLMGRTENKVFVGNMSGIVRFVSNWLPTFVVDRLLSQNQGLKELAAHLAEERKSN